ncbi:sensor histidine kinase [Microbulbifer sp. TYP-18]
MGEKAKNYKQVSVILLCLAVGLGCYVVLTQLSGMLTIRDYQPNPVAQLAYLMIKVWFPWALLSPLVLYLAKRYPITPANWLPMIGVHFVILMSLSLLQTSVISYHYHFFETMSESMVGYQPWQHIGHFLFGDYLFLFHFIIYTIFVASQNLSNFYNFAEEKELESEILRRQLAESKLLALRMQINPHFLFNTLNIISVLVLKEEKQQAAALLEKLSAFFRQTLERSETQWVPLKTEIDIIEQYLFIERARFGERLNVILDNDDNTLSITVPSMILQPLVENAITHGLGEKIRSGTLMLRCELIDDFLLIQIVDDGVGCNFAGKDYNPGIGIENVRQRLIQLYDNDHLFNLKGEPGKGVTVTMKLPIRKFREHRQ